jgi:hypothetical protein
MSSANTTPGECIVMSAGPCHDTVTCTTNTECFFPLLISALAAYRRTIAQLT